MNTITVVHWASHQQHCITAFASLLLSFSFHPSLFSPLTQLFCRKLRLFEERKNLSLLDSRGRAGDDRERITAPLSSHTPPSSTNDNCVELITESCYNRCGTLHLGKGVQSSKSLGVWVAGRSLCLWLHNPGWKCVWQFVCASDGDHREPSVCHMLTKPYTLLNSTHTFVTVLYHRLL